jgi:hypothetical protein
MVNTIRMFGVEGKIIINNQLQSPIIEADLWNSDFFNRLDNMSSMEFVKYMVGDLKEEERLLVGKYLRNLKDSNRLDEITYNCEIAGIIEDNRYNPRRDYFRNN